MQGWVKLHRELCCKAIWQCSTSEQKVVLITILLNVNHEQKEWEWQGKKFVCQPGQMITSLASLAEKCGKGISIQNVRTALDKFEKYGFLTNQSTKTGRLISVENWEIYQSNTSEGNKESNNEPTKQSQSSHKEVTTNKNDKHYKNNHIIYSANFESFWKAYPRKKEKAKAFKNYEARLKNGFSEEEILKAATAYAEECRSRNTEERFIKLGATFLSASTPFTDYLKEGEENGKPNQKRGEAADYYRKFFGNRESY